MTAEISFERNHKPPIGVVEHLDQGLRVITAGNGGAMTYTGSRSYILGHGAVALIDPGPADPAHFQALLAAISPGERVSHVFVTHSHLDHSGLAARVGAHFAAEICAFGDWKAGRSDVMRNIGAVGGGEGVDQDFSPDRCLADGESISSDSWQLEVVHTPGHMGNHVCFASGAHNALFSGDHVMGWSTTLVSPPDGDLTQFMASLDKLSKRTEAVYYPGHGAPIEKPNAVVSRLIAHRRAREAQILQSLDFTGRTIPEITATVYQGLDKRLLQAAARNVLAHLIDLHSRGEVSPIGTLNAGAKFVIRRPKS